MSPVAMISTIKHITMIKAQIFAYKYQTTCYKQKYERLSTTTMPLKIGDT